MGGMLGGFLASAPCCACLGSKTAAALHAARQSVILRTMGILIGMDEAGYGPNYGPLVVAATAWLAPESEVSGVGCRVSETGAPATVAAQKRRLNQAAFTATLKPTADSRQPPAPAPDLYRLLRTIVSKSASDRRLAIADSKSLYTPGLGLRQLELGLHAVLRSMQHVPKCWSAIVECCDADPADHHKHHCWPDGHDCPLPVDAAEDEVARLETRFTRTCQSAEVRPLLARARLVYPAEFNDLIERYGTKGAVLSHITVGLLREVIDKITNHESYQPPAPRPQSPIFAVCDKHGGRNFYAALLQHHFSEHWIEPIYETHAESRYEWGPAESRTCVSFRMQGERFLPTALASMTAKYLRELSMRAFNEFWRAHVPNLRPTAGYPKDAQRFRKDIAAAQRKLNIDDRILWRNR